MSNVTLEPFEWVELHQDFCQNVYGNGITCTASLATGGTECYNTRSTCQDPANYRPLDIYGKLAPLVLNFCKSQSFLPDGAYYIPSLSSVTLSAGSINPIGAGASSSALGTRGGITVQLQDHPHTDKWVDPYIANRMSRDANYIATERGTFWTKWKARNPYYIGRTVKHHTGFIKNGAVVDVVTRTYFVTTINGPDASGRVTIQGKDLLTKLSDEKAKAPFVSKGTLLAPITASDTAFTLNPVGIGNDEYPASGLLRIGAELCTFTRVGDAVTIVRGRHNTEAKDAKAGDVVQLCLVYDSKSPAYILEDLEKNFAGIDPDLLDLAQWAQEQTDYMPRLYSGIIAEPTGVNSLVSEMAEQMYFYQIWDERNSLLKMRAIRPAQGDTIYQLDEFANLEQDSVDVSDLNDQLITQVWVYYAIINPIAGLTDETNYAAREIIFTDEGSAVKNGVEKIKKIFCRWIGPTNGAAAVDLGKKIIARYGRAPRKITFALSNKDSDVWLGDFATINHRSSVDATGAPLPLNVQVMSAQQNRPGTRFVYTAQEFVFEAPVDVTDKLIIISADTLNVNLRDAYDDQFAMPPAPGDTVRFEIRPGVVIGARGYEFSETFSGSLKGYYYKTTPTTITRDFAPLMRREATTVTNFAVGATYTSSLRPFELMSDMREVPPSIALDTGTWPGGVTLILTIGAGATVIGEGGFCSVHGGLGALSGGFRELLAIASDGGNAMRIRHPITITNNGRIAGGGAGGFPSVLGAWLPYFAEKLFSVQPSGTGAGHILQPALTVADLAPMYPSPPGGIPQYSVETTPSGGSLIAGGTGSVQVLPMIGGLRAYGRNAGAPGIAAQSPVQTRPAGGVTPQPITKASKSGRAGYAISEGASLITWVNKGDVRGDEVL